jgi:hypothetical protein
MSNDINMVIVDVLSVIGKNNILYALLDENSDNARLLISSEQKQKIHKLFKNLNWRPIKNAYKKEVFLYGMDSFEDFVYLNFKITLCYQLACKSTMMGNWIPLDRKINEFALAHRIMSSDKGFYVLNGIYDIPYRIAKCIFTEKIFSVYDIDILQKNENLLDKESIIESLGKVFFKFTPVLINMLRDKDYGHIVSACFNYSDY